MSATRHLQTARTQTRFRKGWTPERRALQAAVIRRDQPWQRSTGPKTEAGKLRCAMNALKHGERSAATILEFRRVRRALRLAAWNIARLRAHIRARIPRIKYKAWYEPRRTKPLRSVPHRFNPPPHRAVRACLADLSAEAQRAKAEAAKQRRQVGGILPRRPLLQEH